MIDWLNSDHTLYQGQSYAHLPLMSGSGILFVLFAKQANFQSISLLKFNKPVKGFLRQTHKQSPK
jgi:hypothetical protein